MTKKKSTSLTRKKKPDVSLLKDQQSEEQHQENKYIKRHLQTIQMRKAYALQLLSGTNNPSKFKFRQKQIEQITDYINQCMQPKKKGYKILMITGSPGAGKTLSASTILSKMKYRVIRLNGNIIKSVKDVQYILCSQLLGKEHGKQISTTQIMRYLEQEKSKEKCILYIEEIQMLFNQKINIFTEDFLHLFNNPKLSFMLMGISNTIDALQKYGQKIFFNIKEIKNVVFKPYSIEQIKGLLEEKVEMIKKYTSLKIIYPQQVLRFTAIKLINLKKGDFRIALQFLKLLADKVLPNSTKDEIDVQKDGYQVDAPMINSIFIKLSNVNDKFQLILTLPLNQQMALVALYHYQKRTEMFIMMPKDLISDMKWICQSLKLNYQPKMINQALQGLQQYAMIANMPKNNQKRIMLKVSLGDIEAAFSDHTMLKRFFEQK